MRPHLGAFASVDLNLGQAKSTLWWVSLAVFLASSTWFSGTAAILPLQQAWSLEPTQSSWLTISVQLGFIVGTFLYAVFNLADVYNARRVFCASALLGAACNAAFATLSAGLPEALAFRFLTGLTLAGVYPVGMKIVASWFQTGLGWRLGVMVGALTLGTASPYLLQHLGAGFPWQMPVLLASLAAVGGGLLMLFGVRDGPFLKRGGVFDARVMFRVFSNRRFRLTALGYFGHMWELYAFWSLLVFYLQASYAAAPDWVERVPLLAFLAIAAGALGCALGGWMSRRVGEQRVALVSLLSSGALCALSPFVFGLPPAVVLWCVLVWGVFVVADSPQFSALAARYAPQNYVGTALTVQNGVGFAITVLSIQALPLVAQAVGWRWAFLWLLPGPMAGAWATWRLARVLPD